MPASKQGMSVNEPNVFPLHLEIHATNGAARASTLSLPHGPVNTPVFMPVGTLGTIKGLTSEEMSKEVGCQIILGNTYHLALRPGADTVESFGGLHEFMNWPNNILTDSGGFQMVSLVELSEVSEEGVHFCSPVDGTPMLLTPERSIQLQNQIGADIIMPLDDVVSSLVTGPRIIEATYRTLRWIDRCIEAHARPHDQNLFGIVQGGLDTELRTICLNGMMERDQHLAGYSIGGVSGGEDKNKFWRVVHQCCQVLPATKPRYLMGVGYPLDLVVCSALGVDMFDCVYPCRTARFGTALIDEGTLKLRRSQYADQHVPIDSECSCYTCRNYSRAYLHRVVTRDPSAAQLVTLHNMAYTKRLMDRLRQSIIDGCFTDFVKDFVRRYSRSQSCPAWAKDALAAVSIQVE